MRSILLVAPALAGAAILAQMASGLLAAPEKEQEKVLRHIVMYEFKPTTTKEQVQEVIDAFAGLPWKIDTIVGFEHGTNVSHEGKSEGFAYVFVVTFQDEAGRETYLKHPAHDEYMKVVRDKRQKVVVFDYWAAR